MRILPTLTAFLAALVLLVAAPTAATAHEDTTEASEDVVEGAGLVTVPGEDSVAETVERIEADLAEADPEVVEIIDHAAAAEEAGLQLRPTTLVILGAPPVGTPLMQQAQSTGIDLPQKLLVTEDGDGQVHVTYNHPGYLAARHGLDPDTDELAMAEQALAQLAGVPDEVEAGAGGSTSGGSGVLPLVLLAGVAAVGGATLVARRRREHA